jgi:hypothetical protein
VVVMRVCDVRVCVMLIFFYICYCHALTNLRGVFGVLRAEPVLKF